MHQKTREKADGLRKSGCFKEAAAEYAALWPDRDVWTGWGYAHCLRKVGRSKEALAIASEVHELDPGFVLGRSIYAWTLYDVHIRGSKTLDAEVLKAAQTIVDLTNDDRAYEPTSAFAITVLYVAKLWADAQRDLRVLEWLDKLDHHG